MKGSGVRIRASAQRKASRTRGFLLVARGNAAAGVRPPRRRRLSERPKAASVIVARCGPWSCLLPRGRGLLRRAAPLSGADTSPSESSRGPLLSPSDSARPRDGVRALVTKESAYQAALLSPHSDDRRRHAAARGEKEISLEIGSAARSRSAAASSAASERETSPAGARNDLGRRPRNRRSAELDRCGRRGRSTCFLCEGRPPSRRQQGQQAQAAPDGALALRHQDQPRRLALPRGLSYPSERDRGAAPAERLRLELRAPGGCRRLLHQPRRPAPYLGQHRRSDACAADPDQPARAPALRDRAAERGRRRRAGPLQGHDPDRPQRQSGAALGTDRADLSRVALDGHRDRAGRGAARAARQGALGGSGAATAGEDGCDAGTQVLRFGAELPRDADPRCDRGLVRVRPDVRRQSDLGVERRRHHQALRRLLRRPDEQQPGHRRDPEHGRRRVLEPAARDRERRMMRRAARSLTLAAAAALAAVVCGVAAPAGAPPTRFACYPAQFSSGRDQTRTLSDKLSFALAAAAVSIGAPQTVCAPAPGASAGYLTCYAAKSRTVPQTAYAVTDEFARSFSVTVQALAAVCLPSTRGDQGGSAAAPTTKTVLSCYTAKAAVPARSGVAVSDAFGSSKDSL